MIYINGDSHSAGAELVDGCCFAADDRRYIAWGSRAHPEAIPLTFGYKIAQALNQPFFMDAESASSNDRILRTTRQFVEQTQNKSKLFCVIGWTTWDREEWEYQDGHIQITASGIDSVPESMQGEYKECVINQTREELRRKRKLWTKQIMEFSQELVEQDIKHIFFHTYDYIDYLKKQGYQTINDGEHFGIDAHTAWFKHLLPQAIEQFGVQNTLTNVEKRSIVNTVKEQFIRLREGNPEV